jgi:hypothetical protein
MDINLRLSSPPSQELKPKKKSGVYFPQLNDVHLLICDETELFLGDFMVMFSTAESQRLEAVQ